MPARSIPASSRNLVVCCDGTGNEIGVNLSSVLKLYRILEKDEQQLVFYDPGIGTIGKLASWGRLRQKLSEFFGLATGYGLDDNILDAYRWLCSNWRKGDRIFLFGFSRGAYTVRAVAGMVNMVGLLRSEQLNIADYALTAYKRAMEANDLPIAWQFQRVSESRDVSIQFLGVWDTVASVIVPRPDRFYIPSLQFLPYTKQNARVRVFRQACALDERRRMFRLYRWLDNQDFKPTRFWRGQFIAQDSKQVWFAGVHADIGGGYPEAQSAISKYPLMWMIAEAEAQKVRISKSMFRHLVLGAKIAHASEDYEEPNTAGETHDSLRGFWRMLEIIPRRTKWLRWPRRRRFLGFYLPLGEPRLVVEGARLHASLVERLRRVASYKPVNLPDEYVVEPYSKPAAAPLVRKPRASKGSSAPASETASNRVS